MSDPILYKFRLYVAGDTQNSVEARSNLAAFCLCYLPKSHEIEIVDVFLEPKRALADGIFMTPTLMKLTPNPILRIIGTLNNPLPLLRSFGLEAASV